MGMGIFLSFLLAMSAPALSAAIPNQLKTQLDDLLTGPPHLQEILGASGYVEVPPLKIPNVELMYLNTALLRELGIDIAEPISLEIKNLIIERITQHTLYADRYGGTGTGKIGSQGSGRAAAVGRVHIKGIGRTPLATLQTRKDHSDGILPIQQAVLEAAWAELFNRELPWGANRVLAILKFDEQALLVRMSPLRPAHFFFNRNAEPKAEAQRVRENLQRLPHVLSPSGDLKTGLFDFAKRLADQAAAAYARRLYQPWLSPSNLMLDGGYLDFGYVTAQAGFEKIHSGFSAQANGDAQWQALREEILLSFLEQIEWYGDASIKMAAPTKDQLIEHFNQQLKAALEFEMVRLTGVNSSTLEQLRTSPELQRLGSIMLRLSQDGTQVLDVKQDPSLLGEIHGTYDLTKLLPLAAEFAADRRALNKILPRDFADAYFAFFQKAGIETDLVAQAKLRNAPQFNLYNFNVKTRAQDALARYSAGEKQAVSLWIQNFSINCREFLKTPPRARLP